MAGWMISHPLASAGLILAGYVGWFLIWDWLELREERRRRAAQQLADELLLARLWDDGPEPEWVERHLAAIRDLPEVQA
jgi:hypothetical protein